MRATLIIRIGLLAAAPLLVTLAACTSGSGAGLPTAATTAAASSVTTGAATAAVSQQVLPLGDGHVGSTARVGYVDACQTSFPPGGGGAFRDGPWIHGATWDATAKLAVQGSVSWPQARYAVTVSGDRRIFTTNDLPERFTTGVFPIAATDPAFAYDRNPNTIGTQSISYAVPAHPTIAASPTCLNMGAIGVLSDGVVLFNALDAEGRDAVAHEVLDRCGGHPERSGTYHHHDIPPCLLATATGTSTLVGYARDGFGVYVERDAQGNLPTDADLDACHGRTGPVTWDGGQVTMYHYVATAEYPFTLGCYRGIPSA
jgi:hypothetical protein